MRRSSRSWIRHRRAAVAVIAPFLVGLVLVGLFTAPVSAADGLTIQAKAKLQGHGRIGGWMEIEVSVRNDGPDIDGELRVLGGTQSKTRFGTAALLPSGSNKSFHLYVQPPVVGKELEIGLFRGADKVATTKATFAVHQANQLIVGVVAERPQAIVGGLRLVVNPNELAAAVLPLAPEDLPDRVEAWTSLDRLVWQDLDSSRLSAGQLTALRGWVAGGGRLVIVGGTAGPAALSAFPDALLPYRPDATIDVPRTTIATLAPGLPTAGADVPGLSGQLSEGTVLAAVGDRPVAAERPYGSGSVTLVGIDPTASWITESKASDILWRRLLPSRSVGTLSFGDDSQIIGAVANLPSLALPPLTGLLALLGAYILLIGPINYLVLRRLDRREWAWVTMPVLIVAFAAGAYVFGSTLRGSEVIVNEVAIVRGAPGATDGTAQSYLGVFSPSRGTYQLEVPGGALLSSPINADFFGGGIASTDIDVVQGDPARVRDLAVSFGSMRAIRAESAVTVPLIRTDLRLEGGRLKGTITNASTVQLEKPALVLGSSVVKLSDLTPGQVVTVDAAPDGTFQGLSLADRIVGQVFGDGTFVAEQSRAMFIRQAIVNQLTFDPNVGSTNQLPADGPVLLAWGSDSVLDVRIAGQKARRTGTVLYYLPTDLKVSGRTTFRNDLIRSTVVATDAAFFTKDPFTVSFGKGSATVTYRPIAMNGRLDATELVIGMNFGGDIGPGNGLPGRRLDPLPSVPPACGQDGAPGCGQGIVDGMPELELFDRVAGTWRRFPHIAAGTSGTIPSPTRYVDPETGSIQVRYVNDQSDQIGFTPAIAITGDVR